MPSIKSKKPHHIRLGRRGERCAARALRRRGYSIIDRNYRTPVGEIDIVARHGDTLVFVEVKTRRNADDILPEDSVGTAKQRHIYRTAQFYLNEKNVSPDTDCRFDVISVTLSDRWWSRTQIEIFQNAFDAPAWG